MSFHRLGRAALVSVALLVFTGCSSGIRRETRATVDAATTSAATASYFPEPGNWQRRRPGDVGMDSARLAAAVAFAIANETKWSRDMKAQLATNTARERYPEILGPFKDRGGPAGVIVRHGFIVAEWGDLDRVDMTFSVSKSYLATTAGLAFDRGLIKSVDDPVRDYVKDGGFDSPHNSPITWRMLLSQTSEWEGTLWDKPDAADRRAGVDRQLNPAGTFWEYNDVRVNRTALALLRVWKKPLPEVLAEQIMRPIGASSTWQWHNYRNAWADIDGRRMPSVSGGGHWGGGVWANTLDHARFGYLMLRRGRWKDRQLLSDQWITMATTPTPIKPVYGFMWWLNTGGAQFTSAPQNSVFALGAGSNVIWIDPQNDILAVVRWIDNPQIDGFMRLVVASMGSGTEASR
jgi:CubicO group peptidase (beta-lactamase class C family)